MKKTLSMITMNAHRYTLDIIKESWKSFDKFIIVDGGFKRETFGKYEILAEDMNDGWAHRPNGCLYNGLMTHKFSDDKLIVIDRPWNDNFSEAYWAHLDLLDEGDWVLIVDSDEYPSQLLMDHLDKIIKQSDNGNNYDMVMLPVVDFLDGEKLWEDKDVPQIYQKGMWTKHILLRKGKERIKLHYFGSHVIPLGNKYIYYPYPYYHKKNTENFIFNELWQMFLHPTGQRLSILESERFKQGCKVAKIKSSHEFIQRIKEGTIGPLLEKLAIENREKMIGENGDLHPLCQLFVYYFLVCDNGREPNVKKYNDKEWYFEYIRNWKKNNHTYKNYI